MVFTIGAIHRSKGRDYGEISKIGIVLGLALALIFAVLALFSGLVMENVPVLARTIAVFVGTIISVFLTTLIGALIYDLSEWARKA